jgi:hypothetical protein
MRLTPYGFINSIVGNKHPIVIDPNGETLVPSHSDDFDYQFTDAIARIWAEQNNGIYIPSGFGSPDKRLPFKTLLNVLGRIRPNYSKRDGDYDCYTLKKMHEASVQGNAFIDLTQEVKYLDDVWGFITEVNSLLERGVVGLEGIVHKKDGSKQDTLYQCEGGWFEIRLGLDMRGFGWEHFKVSRRQLSAEVIESQSVLRGSDKESTINIIVNDLKKAQENRYTLTRDFIVDDNNDQRYSKVIIRMNSPNIWHRDNSRLEEPVMQTEEMLKLFVPVVTAVVDGLSRLKKHKEAQRNASFQTLRNIVKPPENVTDFC